MNDNRYSVSVKLEVTDAETGDLFSSSEQVWASMSLKSVVGIERVLHNAQDELISWSETELAE